LVLNLASSSANSGSTVRSLASGRSSSFPKSPNTPNGSSSSLAGNVPVTNGVASATSNCAQKRFKIECEEEEQTSRDCRAPLSSAHSIPVRKRVKVTFMKEANSGFCGDLCGVDRK